MSFECLNPNSQYRVHISRPRGKNGFFAVRCRFSALFENSICGFFLEMSEGTEISTVKISGKKLMILVHLPYKYLSHTTITLEYIGKTNRMFFFRPHSSSVYEPRPPPMGVHLEHFFKNIALSDVLCDPNGAFVTFVIRDVLPDHFVMKKTRFQKKMFEVNPPPWGHVFFSGDLNPQVTRWVTSFQVTRGHQILSKSGRKNLPKIQFSVIMKTLSKLTWYYCDVFL